MKQLMSAGSCEKSAGAVAAKANDMEMNQKMLNMCMSWIYPAAIRTIVQLDVPHILATNNATTNCCHEENVGMTAEEILQHIILMKNQKHEEPKAARPNALNLERLLRLLTTKGIFAEHIHVGHDSEEGNKDFNGRVQRRFSLTPLSRRLVPGDGSVRNAALFVTLGPEYAHSLEYISDAVLNSEEPFTKANGMNQFEYMQSHPAFMAMFKDGLVDISPALLPMLLSKYHGFEGVQKLLDVGGSTAEILVGIKHKYPHIHAINFDLPGVIASNPNLPGIEQVEGDMFEKVPSGCDAIFLKAILHDWNDEKCLRLLNNCWEALPSAGGKLILLDHIMPLQTPQEATDPEGQQVFTTDFMMQLHCASGRERSATELERLLKQARFTNFQVITDVGPCYVMEAFK